MGFNSGNIMVEFDSIGNITRYGYLGVYIFFIISGFVIFMSVQNRSLVDFLKTRIIRLYPAYWACLVLTSSIILIYGGEFYKLGVLQFVANATMFNGYLRIPHVDGVYWSLMVEIQFYFIMALMLLVNRYKKISFELMMWLWLLFSYSQLFIDFKSNIILEIIDFSMLLSYSSYFIGGMVLYNIFAKGINFKNSFLLFMAVVLSVSNAIQLSNLLQEEFNTLFNAWVDSLVIIIFFIFMLLISINVIRSSNSRVFFKMGILTYPLYLLHQKIGYIVFNKLSFYIDKHVLLLALIFSMLIVSYYLNLKVEKPLAHWLKRILSVNKKPTDIIRKYFYVLQKK